MENKFLIDHTIIRVINKSEIDNEEFNLLSRSIEKFFASREDTKYFREVTILLQTKEIAAKHGASKNPGWVNIAEITQGKSIVHLVPKNSADISEVLVTLRHEFGHLYQMSLARDKGISLSGLGETQRLLKKLRNLAEKKHPRVLEYVSKAFYELLKWEGLAELSKHPVIWGEKELRRSFNRTTTVAAGSHLFVERFKKQIEKKEISYSDILEFISILLYERVYYIGQHIMYAIMYYDRDIRKEHLVLMSSKRIIKLYEKLCVKNNRDPVISIKHMYSLKPRTFRLLDLFRVAKYISKHPEQLVYTKSFTNFLSLVR